MFCNKFAKMHNVSFFLNAALKQIHVYIAIKHDD